MALPRYQAKDIAVKPSSVAVRAQGQATASLLQNLEQFKGMALQSYQREVQKDASKEAETAFMSDGLNARTIEENTVYGQTYDARIKQLYNQRVKMDISAKGQELYLQNPNDPESFYKNFDAYQDSYMAKVDPSQKADINMQFASEKASHLARVNQNAFKKLKNAEKTTADEFTVKTNNAAGNAARQLNGELAQYKYGELVKHIKESEDLGIYTSDEASRLRRNAEFGFISNTLYGKNDYYIERKEYDKARILIDDLKGKQTDQYSPEQKDHMIATMERDLSSATKQEKAAADKRKRLVKDEADNVNKSVKEGKIYKQENVVLENKEVLDPIARKDFEEYQAIKKDTATFKDLPYAVQLDTIATLEATNPESGVDIKRLDAFKSINSKLKRTINDSPIDAAIMQGHAKEPIEKVKDFTPEGLSVLADRISLANTAKDIYGKTAGAFTNAEATIFSESWPTMNSIEKASLTKEITKNLPTDIARATLGQLNKKRGDSLFIAGNLMIEGKRGVATEIFQGNAKIAEQLKGITPQELTWGITSAITPSLGNADANTFKGYSEAVKSVYINRALSQGIDPSILDTSLLEETINDVTGGLAKINGRETIVPKHGMSEDQMEDWWDNLSTFDIANMGGIKVADPLQAPEIFENVKEDGELIAAGQGKYMIKVGGHFVQNKAGTNLVITYKGE